MVIDTGEEEDKAALKAGTITFIGASGQIAGITDTTLTVNGSELVTVEGIDLTDSSLTEAGVNKFVINGDGELKVTDAITFGSEAVDAEGELLIENSVDMETNYFNCHS